MEVLFIRKWFVLLALVLILTLSSIFSNINQKIDLTSTSIYTLDEQNIEIFKQNENKILATLLLGNDIPSAFKKLKKESEFFLSNLGSINNRIRYDVFDPNIGSINQVNALRKIFAEKNVFPTNLRVKKSNEVNESLIYPFIHLESNNKEIFVNILESRLPNETEQEAIFRSITSLESKLAKAIFELSKTKKSRVVLVAFEERIQRNIFDFINNVGRKFETAIVGPKDLYDQRDSVQVAIVPVDQNSIIDKEDLLYIDQFVMNGGDIVWLLEEYDIHVDSINKYVEYIPENGDLPVSDYLFTNGVKLTGEWIMDLRSSRIPQVVGEQGGRVQTELFNYPFHSVVAGNSELNISSETGQVNLFFPTRLDTSITIAELTKTFLLKSSEYSQKVTYPNTFSFDFLRADPEVEDYNLQNLVSGILIEGQFQSYFNNRFSKNDRERMISEGIDFKESGTRRTEQIVITDQEFVLPSFDKQGRPLPMGYNKWERSVFSDNEKFFINCIEYLINGDKFLMPDEKRELKFASIDKAKAVNESQFWILFNLLTPLLVLFIIYFGTRFHLNRRYA